MDYVPEKSALEVDEINGDERVARRLPSQSGGESAGAERVIEDADDEVSLPIVTGEEKELAHVHTVIHEELWPPVAEVALPFAGIVNFDAVFGLANAALP
jgi:hypothetical protein